MKNMKKLLCMLLALSMVIALCACGSSTEDAATEEAPAEEAAEAPAEEAPAEEEVDYSAMTLDELKDEFGEEVALLVDGVTKLTQISWSMDKVEIQIAKSQVV